jgi:hypothetical protein
MTGRTDSTPHRVELTNQQLRDRVQDLVRERDAYRQLCEHLLTALHEREHGRRAA